MGQLTVAKRKHQPAVDDQIINNALQAIHKSFAGGKANSVGHQVDQHNANQQKRGTR